MLLGFANGADFRNGVNTGRDIFNQMRRGFAFHQRLGCDAPLVVGGRGQARVANHIADGINMRQGGLIHTVDLQLTAAIGLQADIFQRQRVGIPGAAVSVQQAVRFELFTGFQVHDDAIIHALNLFVLFIVANDHAAVPEVIGEGVGHFLIEKRQQAIAGVDQIHLHFHSAEDRRIFAADHPGPINDHMARFVVQAQDRVAVINARVMEVDVCRMVRA